jgi:Protein of unknown function (DUF2846)
VITKMAAVLLMALCCGAGFAQQPDQAQSAEPTKAQERAQVNALLAAAGCGPMETHFDVKTNKHLHPSAQPQPGKALVYIFEEDLTSGASPTTRVGLDGKWMGANQKRSYFFFPVDPGQHRLCTNWQATDDFARLGGALNFTAEAGKTYYFLATIKLVKDFSISLKAVNSAEGPFLISGDAFSTSQVKKPEPQDD